mgnify:CR=1 FL=1
MNKMKYKCHICDYEEEVTGKTNDGPIDDDVLALKQYTKEHAKEDSNG